MRKGKLYTARRIMYGNLRPHFPDIRLDRDDLRQGSYSSVWYSPGQDRWYEARCADIFQPQSRVEVFDL